MEHSRMVLLDHFNGRFTGNKRNKGRVVMEPSNGCRDDEYFNLTLADSVKSGGIDCQSINLNTSTDPRKRK